MWRWEFWVGALLCTASCAMGSRSQENQELAWLLANEGPPLAARRITPKSVFVAPAFTACSEGYREDSLGRCVKIVKLNQAAQWDYFLQQLNSMYPPQPSKKPSAGPFRLPIPLGEPETTTMASKMTSKDTVTTTTTMPTTIEEDEEKTSTSSEPTSTMTTTTEEEEVRPSTIVRVHIRKVPPSTTTEQYGSEGTETPLLIIVANTTEPTTTEMNTGRTETSTARTEMSTYRTDLYQGSTEQYDPTDSIDCPDCYPQVATTLFRQTSTMRPTTQPPIPVMSTRWTPTPVRFPNERPTYIRFPSHSEASSPIWWPPTWEHTHTNWPPRRGHREPRPSWYHQ